MINNEYQLVEQLSCEDLYFLAAEGRFYNKNAREEVEEKCGF